MEWPPKEDIWSGKIDDWDITINLKTNTPGWKNVIINGHEIFNGESSTMMDNKEIHDFFRCAVQLRPDANMVEFDELVNKYVKKSGEKK